MEIPTVIRPPTKATEAIPTLPFVKTASGDATQKAERQSKWVADLVTDVKGLQERNVIVEIMKQKGERPDPWAVGEPFNDHEKAMGLYPDLADPEFASKLVRKKEFAQLASKASTEDTCALIQDEFEATAIQRLVARFLHPTTPYRSLLLNHGVGVGKTCSAITVAETYLESLPGNTVYILAPRSIAAGFKTTIFDVEKLVRTSREERALSGNAWKSPQCTGMTYLRLTGLAGLDTGNDAEDRKTIKREVDKLVGKRYRIMGYRAFALMLEKRFKAIPSALTEARRRDRQVEIVMDLFSDHLVIVDEAHNLRDASAEVTLGKGAGDATTAEAGADAEDEAQATEEQTQAKDANEGRLITPFLWMMASVAEGMRLLLMTATPMYDNALEITFLLNLLHINDTQDDTSGLLLSSKDVAATGKFTKEGEAKLVKLIQRYVSYMRGENPNTFPLRLTPPESAGAMIRAAHPTAKTPGPQFKAAYPKVPISRTDTAVSLTSEDAEIMAALPLVFHPVSPATKVYEVLTEKVEAYHKEGGGKPVDFLLEKTIQIANMTYPNGLFGNNGWPAYWAPSKTSFGGTTCIQYTWKGKDASRDDVFKGKGLESHAPKLASIAKSIREGKGLSFVFSRYIYAGAVPMAMALEVAGWCRVLSNGTPAPLLKGNPHTKGPFYVLLTSNEELSPDFQGLLRYANASVNADGSKVKAIIGSQITSEGLDLKCVRQLHMIDGWYHLNRIEQVEGRGVRFCSHSRLPLTERNCLIYLHVVAHPAFETGDLHAYRIAARKAQPIGHVTRLIKLHSWDCMLNQDAIMLKGLGDRRVEPAIGDAIAAYDLKDRSFTSFCDFSENCVYECSAKAVPAAEIGKDQSTYREFDFRYQFLKLHARLIDLFSEEVAIPLETLRKTIYREIPWSIAAIGLREVLGSLRIRRPDGLYGTLILKNGYILFQPDTVTDDEIPLAYRYGHAYQRIPRTMAPSRALLAAPVRKAEAPVVAAEAIVDETALREAALASLVEWHHLVRDHLTIHAGGVLPKPARFGNDTEFNAWRWLLYHFREVAETVPIACHWWMDSKWTQAERTAVLKHWHTTEPSGDQATYLSYLTADLYRADINGFQVLQDGDLRTYCVPKKAQVSDNCVAYQSVIDKALGAPVERGSKKTMGDLYGMMRAEKGEAVFKTVDLTKGILTGALCSNTSNAAQSLPRIKSIQDAVRKTLAKSDALVTALLDDAELTIPPSDVDASKTRKADIAKRYAGTKHTHPDVLLKLYDLTKYQWCPYMEFLLRVMDRKKVGAKRWFLSATEVKRGEMKPEKPEKAEKAGKPEKAEKAKAVKVAKAAKPEKA